MHFTIDHNIKNNQEEWDHFVQHSDNGTLFHERKFLNYHPPDRFLDHSLIFKNKNKIIALFPAIEKSKKSESYLISHAGASYGGFVFSDISIQNAFYLVEDLLNYARGKNFRRILLTVPPMIYSSRFNNHIEFALIQSGFQYRKREITSVVKLNCTMKEILNLYKNEARTALKKAQKMGIKIQINTDYDAFYSILVANLEAHGSLSATHNLDEIKKLAEMYPDKIFLFGAFLDDEMIAGIINFICNSKVTLAFYITGKIEYRPYRPINLLIYHVMQWANERNFNYFDLGTITINMKINWGLGKFKETFGARGIFRDTFEIIL